VDFAHRPDFCTTRKHKVLETGSGSVLSPCLALSKGPNRVGVSLPSPEDGNRSSFRNVVFSSYLEFGTMDKPTNPVIKSCV
jgi:hypothetical protein